MKKYRLYSVLDYSNGIEQVITNNGKNSMSSDELLKILRDGIKTGQFKGANQIKNKKRTKYVFDMNYYDEKRNDDIKGPFVIEVKNSQKQYLSRTISSIEDLCTMTAYIKKVNKSRIIAGISVAVALLTVSGPTIAKGLNDYLEKENKDDTNTYEDIYENYNNYRYPTPEEIEKGNEDYYLLLQKKSENGDEEARKEYNDYLVDQLIVEQLENQPKTK